MRFQTDRSLCLYKCAIVFSLPLLSHSPALADREKGSSAVAAGGWLHQGQCSGYWSAWRNAPLNFLVAWPTQRPADQSRHALGVGGLRNAPLILSVWSGRPRGRQMNRITLWILVGLGECATELRCGLAGPEAGRSIASRSGYWHCPLSANTSTSISSMPWWCHWRFPGVICDIFAHCL